MSDLSLRPGHPSQVPTSGERMPLKSMLLVGFQFMLLTLTVTWSAALIVVYFSVAYTQDSQFDLRLRSVADQVVSWLYAQTPAAFNPESMELFNIYTEQGFMVERSLSLILEPSQRFVLNGHAYREGYDRKACQTSDWEVRTVNLNGQPTRSLCRMVAPSAVSPGNLIVWLTTPVERHEKRVLEVFSAAAGPFVVAEFVTLLLAYLGLKRGLRLLRRMQEPLGGDPGAANLPVLRLDECPREILPLAQAYNHLLRRSEDRRSSERRFLANAAHQLRTPLAGLTVQAELALQSQDTEALRQCMSTIHNRVDATARLIAQFLSLAQLEDHQRLREGFRAFDVGRVCEEVVLKYLPTAHDQNIDLGLDRAERLPEVYGNAILAGELLTNLVDNALKYTSSGGTVTVGARLAEGGGDVEVSVEDNGYGMSPKDAVAAFTPFTRLRSDNTAGSGLGFSIVQEIAAIHGVVLRLRCAGERGGTTVTATFHGLQRGSPQEENESDVAR